MMGPGLTRAAAVVLSSAVVLVTGGCAARQIGPAPSPVTSVPGPVQSVVLRSGHLRLQVTTPVRQRFSFSLERSEVYPSPPADVELAFGRPGSGQGVNLQIPPGPGVFRTSTTTVVALTLPIPGNGLLRLTSMNGECSVSTRGERGSVVRGRFTCRALHVDVGSGPRVSASGTFEAM